MCNLEVHAIEKQFSSSAYNPLQKIVDLVKIFKENKNNNLLRYPVVQFIGSRFKENTPFKVSSSSVPASKKKTTP
jgi:hypothetical protein